MAFRWESLYSSAVKLCVRCCPPCICTDLNASLKCLLNTLLPLQKLMNAGAKTLLALSAAQLMASGAHPSSMLSQCSLVNSATHKQTTASAHCP